MILEDYVKRIVEAALSSSDALSAGLALYTNGRQSVLYSVSKMKDALWHHKSSESEAIIGTIDAFPTTDNAHGPSYGGLEITQCAAQKGYGPLLYDFVMSWGKPIMPDRESVSPSASSIWMHYYADRPDVKKLRLDDIDDPKTPDPNDDSWYHKKGTKETDLCVPLNYAYAGSGNPCTELLAAHEELCGTFERLGVIQRKNFETLLRMTGNRYFLKRYRTG